MQAGKFARLVKREGLCAVRYIGQNGEDGVYLATRSAVFRDDRFPTVKSGEVMAAVLDMTEKDWRKIGFSAAQCEDPGNVMGLDLWDKVPGEKIARKLEMSAVWRGRTVTALVCQDEELVFIDESLLSPVQKELDGSNYVEFRVRRTESGGKYVAVLNGFELVAAVMTVDVIDLDYLSRLQEFQTLCVQQYEREKLRRVMAAKAQEESNAEL